MSRHRIVLAIIAGTAAAGGALALSGATFDVNPAGGQLAAPAIEVHSAAAQTNIAGGRLELAAPMDRSADISNTAGGFVAIGLLDPNPIHAAEATGWERLE